ncbi:MAG: hypothetical protein R2710_15310 [Acidimicrobiales bacterium]
MSTCSSLAAGRPVRTRRLGLCTAAPPAHREFDVTLVYGPDGEVRGSVSDDYFDGFARAQKAVGRGHRPHAGGQRSSAN